ncbi:MAG: MerC domain-containing protein [Acidobacteria bacterium]|nr:MerC domain-containing protein [Acidobacteriota bacterium]
MRAGGNQSPTLDSRLDTVGGVASFLCAVHCAVLPFVVTLLPLWGLSFLAGETAEWGLLLLAATLGVGSLGLGYRQHRSIRTLALLVGAVGLLVAGRLVEQSSGGSASALFGVLGGLTLMSAHWLNYRLCRSCRKCRIEHSS